MLAWLALLSLSFENQASEMKYVFVEKQGEE